MLVLEVIQKEVQFTWFRGYSSDGAHNAGMITHSKNTISSITANFYKQEMVFIISMELHSTNRTEYNANNIFLPDSQTIINSWDCNSMTYKFIMMDCQPNKRRFTGDLGNTSKHF